VLSGCSRLDSIPCTPKQTPAAWLEMQPFVEVEIASRDFILVQPSSTAFVYLLGLVAIGVGLYFLRIRDHQRSRMWWGIALLLWGLGALSAGTSYQAFSYEIKCSGREYCAWSSWWEVIYLMLSVASVSAMTMAGAYSCSTGGARRRLWLYALLNTGLYCSIVLVGAFVPVRSLISFELMLLVLAPNIAILLILNGRRYRRHRGTMDLALAGTWIALGLIVAVYYAYLLMGITEALWVRGIWFSENDVLHLGLIAWMIYIARVVALRVEDVAPPVVTSDRSLS
jgi:hypothetical protein